MKQPKNCLLIDDDSDDQEIFITAAAEVNPTIICQVVSDGNDALKLLNETSELPDLIFLDINLPKMDGFEILIHLKRNQRLRGIPVIVYSTTRDESQIAKAVKLGASGFVTKAAHYHSLCKILQHFLLDESEGGVETEF
ncbi:MAG TPA: response regulator [Chryseosolibacter sp.]